MQYKYITTPLVIGLLLAQLVYVQHALDLGSHLDDSPCEVCLLSAGLDQALGQDHRSVEFQPVHDLTGGCQDISNPQPLTMAFLARAPPLDLLSI